MAGEYYRPGVGGVSTAFPEKGDIPTRAPHKAPRRGRARRAPTPAPEKKVTIRGGEVFINGVGYSVRPQEQASFIREQTGGRGTSATEAITTAEATSKRLSESARKAAEVAAKESARKAAELAAQKTQTALRERALESHKQVQLEVQQELARREQERIKKLREEMLLAGATVRRQTFIQAETGREVEHITTKKGKERIFETKDLITGERTVRTYAPEKKGGARVRQTGGLLFGPTKEIEPEVVTTKPTEFKLFGPTKAVPTEFQKKIEDIAKQQRLKGIEELKLRREPQIQPVPEPKGILGKSAAWIAEQRAITATKKARGEDIGVLGGLALIGAGALSQLVETGRLGVQLYKKPKETVVKIGEAVKQTGTTFLFGREATFPAVGQMIREEPEFLAGALAGEILLTKGAGKTARIGRKGIERIGARVSGIRVVDDVVRLPKDIGVKGILDLPEPKAAFTEIPFAGKIDDIGVSLAEQARLAGREVTAVSAQRDLFGKLIRRKVVIEKPKPMPTAPELERAFFADPYGRLRVSRLGLKTDKKATFLEYAAGDIQLGRTRPQALVFTEAMIAKFPDRLQDVAKKLKTGKTLTAAEEARLLKWQLTPTGEFKPVGFISKEPEIILAPGEILKKGRPAGTVVIDGKVVEFIYPKIGTVSKKITDLISKSKAGVITSAEEKLLMSLLKKETGFSYREIVSHPYVDVGEVGARISISVVPKPSREIRRPTPSVKPTISLFAKPSPKPRPSAPVSRAPVLKPSQGIISRPRPPTSRAPTPRPPTPRPPTPRAPTPRPPTPRPPTPRPPTPRPPTPRPPEPTPFIPTPFKPTPPTPAKKALKQITKAIKGEFEVFARVEGQDVSIGKVTTKKEAKKLLVKRLRKTIAASGFIEESGKKLSAKETGLLDGEFRTSVMDFGRVVQKKERRLGTVQETKELHFFKSSKGGGNLFGSSNRGRKKSSFF